MPEADPAIPGPAEIRVRVNIFGDRVEAYVDRADVHVRSVAFPVGYRPTVAEIIQGFKPRSQPQPPGT